MTAHRDDDEVRDQGQIDPGKWPVVRAPQGDTSRVNVPTEQYRVLVAFAERMLIDPDMLVVQWLDDRLRHEYTALRSRKPNLQVVPSDHKVERYHEDKRGRRKVGAS